MYKIADIIFRSLGNIFYTPVELLKCRAQVNRDGHIVYKEVITQIMREEGIRGLYRGGLAQLYRDLPGWGSYFWAYEFMK